MAFSVSLLESTNPAISHTHRLRHLFHESSPLNAILLFKVSLWQCHLTGLVLWLRGKQCFQDPSNRSSFASSPFWCLSANRPPGLSGTSLFCQVVSQRRRMVCAQLDSHSVHRKMAPWERDFFFIDCLSYCHFPTSALCFLTSPLYLPHVFLSLLHLCFSFFPDRLVFGHLHIARYSCIPSSFPSVFYFKGPLSFATVQWCLSFASRRDLNGRDNSLVSTVIQ